MIHIVRDNGAKISLPHIIKLSALTNKVTTFVREDTSFIDKFKMSLTFAIALEASDSVKCTGARMHNIVDDMQGFDTVPETSQMTYVRIVWLARMLLRNKRVLLLVERLRKSVCDIQDAGSDAPGRQGVISGDFRGPAIADSRRR